MPINWTVQFKQSILQIIKSGTVFSPDRFISLILQAYDSCIKSGLPLPPASAAGPILGNLASFKTIASSMIQVESNKLLLQKQKNVNTKILELNKEIIELQQQFVKSKSKLEKNILMDKIDFLKSEIDYVQLPVSFTPNSNFSKILASSSSNKNKELQGLIQLIESNTEKISKLTKELSENQKGELSYYSINDVELKQNEISILQNEVQSLQKTINLKQYNYSNIIIRKILSSGIPNYWTGMSSLGGATVLNSGIVNANLISGSPSGGIEKLLDELILCFSAHLKTISGTYLSPSGVILPWIGYF